MTTVELALTPRRIRSGFISALILSVGLTAAIGGQLADAYLRKDISVTVARTVAQAPADAGIILELPDEVIPPVQACLIQGMAVVVRRAVPVTLVVEGQATLQESAAATGGDLLGRRGAVLHVDDEVVPGLDTPVTAGMGVRVVRIEHRLVTEQQETEVQTSPTLAAPRGMRRISGLRRVGTKERLYRITVADGTVVSKTLVGERLVRSPLDRVVRVGTVAQMATDPLTGGAHLNMLATAYSPFCCHGVDDITSMGMKAGYGVVAVDPSVIPLGSRLYVEGYGYAVAGDVGGSIKGLRIDLGFNTKREALRYGVRRTRVYVIEGTQYTFR